MHLNHIDALGFLAGVFTTIAFVPQANMSWRTRDLSGLSLRMYSLFTLGVALWLAYGIALRSWPIIITNTITLLLAGSLLYLKLTHKTG